MNPLKLLPEYPRTRHLFYKPNAQRLDLIATEKECEPVFTNENTFVEEKVDGANCGICFYEGNPVIRNRSNILQKGKSGHLRTPAKLQFAPIWNYCYEMRENFEKLNNLSGFYASVYGEWLYALHGIRYDGLPCYFMVYDVYDWEKGQFIRTDWARAWLEESGFNVVPLLHRGKVESCEQLEKFMAEKSLFSTIDLREGIYIKVCDNETITYRFKWVRPDFIQGCHWSARRLTKNKLI
jgi:atypical dual specificity phosphatase